VGFIAARCGLILAVTLLIVAPGCGPVVTGTGDTLAGSWRGLPTAKFTSASAIGGPADLSDPTAETNNCALDYFDANYDAGDILTELAVMGRDSVCYLPFGYASSVQAGQTGTAWVGSANYNVVIQQADYGSTHTLVVFDTALTDEPLQAGLTGGATGTSVSGTTHQTVEATLSADGQTVTWSHVYEGTFTTTDRASGQTTSSVQRIEVTGTLSRR
jgi:hypothetical protein